MHSHLKPQPQGPEESRGKVLCFYFYIVPAVLRKYQGSVSYWQIGKPVNMPKEHQGHLVRPQVEYAATVWDPLTTDNIKKVEAVQKSRQICDRRLSLHQQCHWHDLEPFLGNTPAQKTASQGHNDVPYCTCHGSYTSLSTPPATRCCYKRPPGRGGGGGGEGRNGPARFFPTLKTK